MNHQLMTIVVQRPSDEAQLQSYLLGLEVLWPFQIASYAGDATEVECRCVKQQETAAKEVVGVQRI